MKKLIFFIIASAILLFSIIVVNIAPIINGLISSQGYWSKYACSRYSDSYDDKEKKSITATYTKEEKEKELDKEKKKLNRCNRKKAMAGLEYVVSNVNIIFGFICSLLGFLHFLNVGNMGKYIGLIGLCAGIIGFVLTLVYVIESGLVFNDISESGGMRIDSDGAHVEWDGSKYTCIYYDKDDEDSITLRYSDYGKKYLNYHKDLQSYRDDDKKLIFKDRDPSGGCIDRDINSWPGCKVLEDGTNPTYKSKIKYYDDLGNAKGDCEKLYYITIGTPLNNTKKVLYDRWLTTIIFSCFIFLLNIGLGIFGFLLFRESGGSSGSVAIK